MSIFRRSSVGAFTRGGQTTIHYVRMIWQVVTKFAMVCVFGFLFLCTLIFYFNTDSYQRYVTMKYGTAYLIVNAFNNTDAQIPFKLDDGRETKVFAKAIISSPGAVSLVNHTYRKFIESIVYAFLSSIILFVLSVRFIFRTGSEQAKDEFVRGSRLVTAQQLNSMIRKKEDVGILKVAGVSIPKKAEPAHLLFNGGPGTGKSQLFKEALSSIRKSQQRAVVYDISGDFVQAFYRKGKDIILNPLDARCAFWDIWCEAIYDWDYESIAASLIPDKATGNDPMWALSSRVVFAELAKKVGRQENPTNQQLVDLILKVPKEEMAAYLADTNAAALLDEDGDKIIASIRAMLASYSQSLKYLPSKGKRFSIRQWIQNDYDDDSWVFISSTEEQKEALKPLITVWLDIASSAILSLTRDPNRRIWMAIDELPTLNKLPSLLNTLTNSRKYGGCGIIGYQSYPQLVDIYGKNGAEALCEACSTWAILRANGNVTAQWAAKGLGSTEVLETTEGLSYGVNDIRDGVSLNKNRKLRPIILDTELNNLDDMNGYLKLGRSYPIANFTLKYKRYSDIANDFVDRLDFSASQKQSDKKTSKTTHQTKEADSPQLENSDEEKVKYSEIAI